MSLAAPLARHAARIGQRLSPPAIARRLTIALGTIALAIFAASGALLDWALAVELERQARSAAVADLAMTRHHIDTRSDRLDALARELDVLLESHRNLRVWLIGPDGRPLYGGELPTVIAQKGELLTLQSGGRRYKGMRQPLGRDGALEGAVLLVAAGTAERERLMTEHRITLLAVTLLATAAVVALTAWATRRGLAPVAMLSRHALRITPDTLGKRLPVAGTVRELRDLAHAFNRVLDRLELAYRQLDAFNADVAHELRTPLATMIGGTQVALSSPRSADDLREALASNLEELEALSRLVNDMLFLARADRGERPPDMTTVSLAGEARAVADYFDAAMHEAGLGLAVAGDALVQGNGPLIRRAIANLVSNALRYASPGTTIDIAIGHDDREARIGVRNAGAAIAADEIERMFDRFYRAQAAGGRPHEGSGLGLSIVRAIARMHGGGTFASSARGTTEVGFTLQRAA